MGKELEKREVLEHFPQFGSRLNAWRKRPAGRILRFYLSAPRRERMADVPSLPASLVKAFHEHYELIRETGRGGSATVYHARDIKHDRFVAIKVLAPDLGLTSGERFLREIRVSAGMQHPHILPTYDSGLTDDGRLYFVMPFVDGGSLRDRLNATATLPVGEALRIARDIGVALAHAHELGIVHRDVKPENIMFYHGTACLADFGIARTMEALDPGLTGHGMFVGTPAYMSPEQYAASGFDGRSDVYSLACVLYEMLAGTRLYTGSTPSEVLAQRVVPPSIAALRATLPQDVFALLDRGLAMSPTERFPDATTFVAALEEALRRTQSPFRSSMPQRAFASVRRHAWAYAVGAAGLALLAWPLGRRSPFDKGRVALAAWDIPTAQKSFAAAVAADSGNVAARLWLAEAYALERRLSSEDFRQSALRLSSARRSLHGRDSLFAEALLALATGMPAVACNAYTRQLQKDSTDILAWYGLGDCQRFDSTVVRDPKSKSGWRFTSSYHAAARAYIRAVTLDPNAHAVVPFADLSVVLPPDTKVRKGHFAGPPRQTFLAYPALVADTLAFVPYPLAEFAAITPATISPTQPDALKRNRDLLLEFARGWTVASPKNPDAWEAFAHAREYRGDLSDDDHGAGGAIRQARSLTSIPQQQLLLAIAQVRIHVKRGEFQAARELADSILGSTHTRSAASDALNPLTGLAALTGRVGLSTELMTTELNSAETSADVRPVMLAANRFFARAAPGVCDDTLALHRQEFERVLSSYSTPNHRDQVRTDALARAAALSFPCLRGAALTGIAANIPLDRAQRAFAERDAHRTLALLDSLASVRAGFRPGDISLDHTVQEAWLRAAAGDTAGATRQLDLVLDALPTLGTQAVTEPAQSAAIGRAMVLRADLAAARHDDIGAKRWATGVLQLWGSADAALKPTLDRMKGLTSK